MQGFADIIDRLLHSMLYSNQNQTYYMIDDYYISIYYLLPLKSGENKRMRQVLLQFFKSCHTFLSLFEIFPFMKELEKWPTPICRPRNKPIQSNRHSFQLLYFPGIPKWMQIINSLDLVRINLYSPVCYHAP